MQSILWEERVKRNRSNEIRNKKNRPEACTLYAIIKRKKRLFVCWLHFNHHMVPSWSLLTCTTEQLSFAIFFVFLSFLSLSLPLSFRQAFNLLSSFKQIEKSQSKERKNNLKKKKRKEKSRRYRTNSYRVSC